MALPIAGAFFAALGPWIGRFIMLKGVLLVTGFLGRLGLVLATNEFVMQPLIDHLMGAWNSIPPGWTCWFALFGVTKAAGIVVSALTLISAKRVFFARGVE